MSFFHFFFFKSLFFLFTGIDFKIRTIELDGKKIKLQIWDTAGQERFRTITTAYYRGAMGIMLVYDITNEKSFENIKNWIRNIEENASADVEKMLLGNKCELNDKRQVTKEKGEQLAIEYGIKFIETSAKASIHVEDAFFILARDIKAKTEKKLVCIFFFVQVIHEQYFCCLVLEIKISLVIFKNSAATFSTYSLKICHDLFCNWLMT